MSSHHPPTPPQAKLTVSVVASIGTLTPPTSTPDVMYTLGSAGTPTNSIVFAGRLDDVNALLDGLIFSPPKDYNSVTSGETVVITFSVNDQGNTGASATPLTAEKYLQVFVSAVNDEQ